MSKQVKQQNAKVSKDTVKTFKVKDLLVTVDKETLSFTKEDGNVVTLQRKLGESDYRLVYHFLKKKTDKVRSSNGRSSVGNFSYSVKDLTITIYGKDGRTITSFDVPSLPEKNKVQWLRNQVISKLITVLE